MSQYVEKQYSETAMKLREALLTLSPVVDDMLSADFSGVELDEKNMQALDYIKNCITSITMLQLMLTVVIPKKEDQ